MFKDFDNSNATEQLDYEMWNAFKELGNGGHICKREKEIFYFRPQLLDSSEYFELCSSRFDILINKGLIQQQQPTDEDLICSGEVFILSDEGKQFFETHKTLDDNQREAEFYKAYCAL